MAGGASLLKEYGDIPEDDALLTDRDTLVISVDLKSAIPLERETWIGHVGDILKRFIIFIIEKNIFKNIQAERKKTGRALLLTHAAAQEKFISWRKSGRASRNICATHSRATRRNASPPPTTPTWEESP